MLCFRKMRLFSLLAIVLLTGLFARWWSWLGPGKAQVVWANNPVAVTEPIESEESSSTVTSPESTASDPLASTSIESESTAENTIESTAEPTTCLNINVATQAQLEKLPGIGPVIAQAILAERVKRGRFTDLKDLLQVKGIGAKRFEQLLPHLCVIVP